MVIPANSNTRPSSTPPHHTYTILISKPHETSTDFHHAFEVSDVHHIFVGHSAVVLNAENPAEKQWSRIAIFPGVETNINTPHVEVSQQWSFLVDANKEYDSNVTITEGDQEGIFIEISDKALATALRMWRRGGRWPGFDSRLYVLEFATLPSDEENGQRDTDFLSKAAENVRFGLSIHLTGKMRNSTPIQESNTTGIMSQEQIVSPADVFTLMSFPSADHYLEFREWVEKRIKKEGCDDVSTEQCGVRRGNWTFLTRRAYLTQEEGDKARDERLERELEAESRRNANKNYWRCDEDWFG